MLQPYGILISANHLTIAHDDRSCGQGGEMWFEWEGGGGVHLWQLQQWYPRNGD